MGENVTHTVQLELWRLTDPAALFACLEELVSKDYRGSLHSRSVDGAPWMLEIGGDTATIATVGQVMVLFGDALEAMTPEVYAIRFGAGE